MVVNTQNNWFWRYCVTIYDDSNEKVVNVNGLTIGASMAQAVEAIEEYYGNSLVRLIFLESIVDGGVLDFETAADYDWRVVAEKGVDLIKEE